jgi:endonuclease YncB( thermonuclease family)
MKQHLKLADPRTLYRIWFVLVLRAPSTVRTISWDRYKAVVAVTTLQGMLLRRVAIAVGLATMIASPSIDFARHFPSGLARELQ